MNYLNTNIIVFEEDGYVSLPETYHFAKDYNSEWFIIEDSKSKSNKLVINSSNLAFKDTFKIKFVNDITKGKGLILTSDSLFIKAYKFSIE